MICFKRLSGLLLGKLRAFWKEEAGNVDFMAVCVFLLIVIALCVIFKPEMTKMLRVFVNALGAME